MSLFCFVAALAQQNYSAMEFKDERFEWSFLPKKYGQACAQCTALVIIQQMRTWTVDTQQRQRKTE